jgi:NDP-sugar pyrophosphorylase family protein
MVRVLITTSGTGSRLGGFTRSTNKSLVQVGDKFAICHVIDQYADDTEFIVTLGYFGNYVKDFLELAYPDKKIQYAYVDKYEGPGSSLGYSMLQAKQLLQTPFVFHCCDTIVNNLLIQDANKNILFVHKNDHYNLYSSVNVNDQKVVKMNGKGCKDNDFIYTGLCYIYDYQDFWNELQALYDTNPDNTILSDIHAISNMLQKNITFEYAVLDSYLDTGNLISYSETRKHFISKYHVLAKENESLCFMDNKVIKFVNDKEINRKRVIRGKHLYPYAPAIMASKDNFIVMEFVKGELLSESKTYGEIYNLLEWAQEHLWVNKRTDDCYDKACIRFYKQKTIDRLKSISCLENEREIVNGLPTGKIMDLLESIDFSMLTTKTFTNFHGDFILDNIIKTGENQYCLLDWRHEFDSELYYGDVYYDLAKLRHNMILNHYNILQDLFSIETSEKGVYVDIKCNYLLMLQMKEYNRFITKYNYNLKKIEILTSLIWLNMAPLYDGKLKEFLFYFGKMNLYLQLQEVRP